MTSYVEAAFDRDTDYIPDRITVDGGGDWPVEPGRYRLVVARACPWANRAIIVRRLLGLEDAISMGVCGPTHDERSWTFDLDPGGVDPVLRIPRIQDAYLARFPGYEKGITVPCLVDVPTGQVVTNDVPTITLDLSTQWRAYQRPGAPDLYPVAQRAEMDEVMERIYRSVNNGVYRCGFAGTQDAYEEAYDQLFAGTGLAVTPAREPPVPHGRPPHRGGRPAVHDAGAVRRGLPRPLQVQPAEADRAAGPLGVCAGPVPDAGVRRHGRLRRTSSATTTWSTTTSTRPGSCPRGRCWRSGPRRTTGTASGAARSGRAPRRARCGPARRFRRRTTPRWRFSSVSARPGP